MANVNPQNYYQLLEIDAHAPQHEIVKAYERAKLTYSPDSPALYTMFTKEEAEDLRRLIEEAYKVLSNETRRREYDTNLRGINNKKELPDFAPAPTAKSTKTEPSIENNSIRVDNIQMPTSGTPDGFRRHKYGVYEIKKDFETEIENLTDFTGEFLRKVRTYKNINLEQLSKETRISRTYLNAIETEDYEALPAAVFVRGFLIQYARAIGLDEQKVASSFMSRFKK
jgi:curved DNA-binding protein CbpA